MPRIPHSTISVKLSCMGKQEIGISKKPGKGRYGTSLHAEALHQISKAIPPIEASDFVPCFKKQPQHFIFGRFLPYFQHIGKIWYRSRQNHVICQSWIKNWYQTDKYNVWTPYTHKITTCRKKKTFPRSEQSTGSRNHFSRNISLASLPGNWEFSSLWEKYFLTFWEKSPVETADMRLQ